MNGTKTSFYFLKQLFYNDSLDENVLSQTPWWFINPLEELAVALLALEVEMVVFNHGCTILTNYDSHDLLR